MAQTEWNEKSIPAKAMLPPEKESIYFMVFICSTINLRQCDFGLSAEETTTGYYDSQIPFCENAAFH